MIGYLIVGIFLVETGLSIYDHYKFKKLNQGLKECKEDLKNSDLVKRINKYQE